MAAESIATKVVCIHVVGLHRSGYHDGIDCLIDLDDLTNQPWDLEIDERFAFCPDCGAKIDHSDVDAELKRHAEAK